jgi:hypothetical protein
MNEMNITIAQYILDELTSEVSSIKATIDGVEMSVPLVEGNRHYDEIMRQVDAGELTIADAE